MRRVFHCLIIAIFGLAGCAADNCGKVQIPEGRQCEIGEGIEPAESLPTGSPLPQDIPEVESVSIWPNKYGPGIRLTTAHYEIFTTLNESRMLHRIPGFMESVCRAYRSQVPQVVAMKTGLAIYIFADRQQWEEFTKDFAGEQAHTFLRIKAGAYYHNGACVAYDIGPARTLSVLGHEGWHQFSDRHFKFRPPSWLDEGVAMLFETNDAEAGTFQLAPAKNAYRLDTLRTTLENDGMIPLRELIASNPGDVLATDRTETVMAFYSQSYALVRFMQEADSGSRLAAYRRLLDDGLKGRWQLDSVSAEIAIDRNIPRNILWNHIVGLVLFEDYVGKDYDRIEKEYLAFCKQITDCRSKD